MKADKFEISKKIPGMTQVKWRKRPTSPSLEVIVGSFGAGLCRMKARPRKQVQLGRSLGMMEPYKEGSDEVPYTEFL